MPEDFSMFKIMISYLYIAVVCICGVSYSCFAQGTIGEDYLALNSPTFPVRSASSVLPLGRAVGILDFTFGTSTANLEYILRNNAPSHVRIHFLNNTCVRNRNCGKYEPLAGYTLSTLERGIRNHDAKIFNHLTGRLSIYKSIAAINPNTIFLVSPILEHNLSIAGWRILADFILQQWPGVKLVNSPMRGNAIERYRGSYNEQHGVPVIRNAQIYSHDGNDATDTNMAEWMKATKGSVLRFSWSRGYNLRTQGTTWVDPRARTAAYSREVLEEIVHITDTPPAKPTLSIRGCKEMPFDSTFIWKPLAEDKGTGDTRANYPVLITKQTGSKAVLVTFNGKFVSQLQYYGKYIDGRSRYYQGMRGGSKENGYQIQKKAMALSGSPYVYYKSGNRCFGPILTGRRQGAYR